MDRQPETGTALREHALAASQLLKAVGNPMRLMILCALVDGEHSVGELRAFIDLSMSALSQHLAVLKREGLVYTRREAQTIYYSLADHEVRELIKCLHRMYCE
jgi:DNA-binding transcriptional ArsR family regulator